MSTGTHEVEQLKATAANHGISLWSQAEHYIAYAKAINAPRFRDMTFDEFFEVTQAVDTTFVGEADSYVELQARLKSNDVIAPDERTLIQYDGLWFEKDPA